MNRLYLLLILVLLASCHPGDEVSTALLPLKQGGAYGYVTRLGSDEIPFIFSRASCFSGGVAAVAIGNPMRWGYIDNAGRYVIKPIYSYATSFSEGVAFVVRDGAAPEAIDKNGIRLFSLPDVQSVENFSEGLAAYSVLDKTGEIWGFVDRDGQTVIAPAHAAVSYFSEGLCAVMGPNGYWGYIDENGKTALEPVYNNAHPFMNGLAKVMLRGRWAVIDHKGHAVIPPRYNDIDVDGGLFLVKEGDKWGWINKEGRTVIPIRFADAYPFSDNDMAAVRLGEKWGYINGFGKFVIPATYDFAFGFENGLALVQVDGKYGFINKEGQMVIPAEYEHVAVDYFIRYFARTSARYSVKTDINSPERIAYKWLTGFYHMDYYEASRNATKETGILMDQFADLTDMISDSSRQEMMGLIVGISDCVVSGDKAVVTYTLSDNRRRVQKLYLVKREGRWLVEFPVEGLPAPGQ